MENTLRGATAAQDRGEDVIILSVGDPDLDTPQPVLERAIEALRAGDTHYTPVAGRELLREAIAHAHRDRTGQAVEAANVIFLAGAQNALFAASLCLAGPGDEVLALEPLYPTYPATLEVSGARMVRVPAPASSGFRVDLAALESAITPRTRALFFATPNNPSGVVLSAADLAVIGELARRHALWVVADEVYAGLAPGGRVPSLAASSARASRHHQQLCPRRTRCRAGAPAGWSGPQRLIAHAEALAMCMLYGLPGFVQEAALTAVRVAAAAESRMREFCASRREIRARGLAGIPGLRCSCAGRRHVHADRCARQRSVGIRFHERVVSIGRCIGARRRRIRQRDGRVRAPLLRDR